jgi:hypothetical protein
MTYFNLVVSSLTHRGIATGKKIVFQQVSVEQFKQGVQALALPPHIALDMLEFMQAWDEFGCAYCPNFLGNIDQPAVCPRG